MSISKIVPLNVLKNKLKGKKFSLVHGVFDLLHIGHIRHFEEAKKFSDLLVVSITADKYVNKGPSKPVFKQELRSEFISSLTNVDYVYINNSTTAVEIINEIKPNFYVKGVDYKNLKKDLSKNIYKEKSATQKNGGKIVFTDNIQFSSSSLINENLLKYNLVGIKDKKIFKNNCLDALKKIENLNIALIGEIIIDKYTFFTDLEKPSKEMIPAVEEKSNKVFLGGTYAIAKNLSEFCRKIDLFVSGKITKDIEKLINKEKKLFKNINTKIFKNDYQLIEKNRFIGNNGNKVFEIYKKNSKINKLYDDKLNTFLKKKLKNYDLVILADYGHGFVSPELKNIITKKSKFLSINAQTNADNRGFNLITKYKKADCVTIDLPELMLAVGNRDKSISQISEELMKKIKCKNLIITKGKNGIHITSKNKIKNITHYFQPAFNTKPVDTIGAGDVVLGIASLLFKRKTDPDIVAFISNILGALYIKIPGHEKNISKLEVMKSIEHLLK